MDKSNKVFCTYSKCHHKDTERVIGLFIPKSTRTRYHKQNDENSLVLDFISSFGSETASILSLSDVYTSSKSELSILVGLSESLSEGEASSSLSDRAENSSVNEGYIDEESTIQDIDDNYELSSNGTSLNGTDEFSDSDISHIEISESREYIHLSDELAFNSGNVSLFQVRRTLQSIVPIEPTWVDICINSCYVYTGKYKYDELYEYCHMSRFQTRHSIGKRLPQHKMAIFFIKDRLKIQYQDLKGFERLKYYIIILIVKVLNQIVKSVIYLMVSNTKNYYLMDILKMIEILH
ncbi:6790_t:CDS:2 [Funneliformis caledonium]|uniref:6790_t:CDS:1 n=1 Tax=Funneliformis caledonium TaxID=1117310 RepID=A0A9N9NBH5_9GLOM|nr:6790_t:CDS:2 [Funneliformis caledonium]